MLKIEKGVPLPRETLRAKPVQRSFSLMREMEIGDSVLFAGDDFAERNILAARCSELRHHYGISTVTRREAGGYRVWRTG